MDQIGKLMTRLKPKNDDDSVDRLNYYYTTYLLLFFAAVLGAKQYVGQPIQCWVPAEYKDSWEQYSEDYCYIENTYWIPYTKDLPVAKKRTGSLEISYYQWVPFVLAIQALMFYFPKIIWRVLNWQSGVNVKGLINAACEVKAAEVDKRPKQIETVCGHIQDSTFANHAYHKGLVDWGLTAFGGYVSMIYMFVKALYMVNIVGQFFLLNKFLGPQHSFWGAAILQDLTQGKAWNASGHFPRCVLMINMFNEKIFLFLWWWFVIIAVVTVANFIYWLLTIASRSHTQRFIQKHLSFNKTLFNSRIREHKLLLQEFVKTHLCADSIFVLRLIENNAGEIICTDIVQKLWGQTFGVKQLTPPGILPLAKHPAKDTGSEKTPLIQPTA